MPSWLRRELEQGAKVTITNRLSAEGRLVQYESIANETRGVVPILSQLCEQDQSLSKVYFCHPDVQHVVKMAKEGGFCGYRNIQMMVSRRPLHYAVITPVDLRNLKPIKFIDIIHSRSPVSRLGKFPWTDTIHPRASRFNRAGLGSRY